LHLSSLAKRSTLLVFAVFIVLYCYGLHRLPFLGPDEPRYAQVAREMFLRGDLITPTLGGRTWFEKPALLYWMMMASFKVFGVSEFAARLPSILSGLLTVLALFVIGKQLNKREPATSDYRTYYWWALFVGGTTAGLAVFSAAASFDVLLTMTITWAFTCFISYQLAPEDKRSNYWLAGFYVFVGLSLLAKGLVGIVIPVGVLSLYYLGRRKLPARHEVRSLVWGIPLTLLVTASWYVPVTWRHGWLFIDQFIIQHHFARYISDKYRHWQPFYYYLEIVPLLAVPWTAYLIDSLVVQTKASWRARYKSGEHRAALRIFAFAWASFPLLFFSFSGSKLPGYILPVLPAVALLVADRVTRISADAQQQRTSGVSTEKTWPVRATAILAIIFAVGQFVFVSRRGNLSLICGVVIALLLLVPSVIAVVSQRWRDASIVITGLAVLSVILVALFCLAPTLADRESSKRLLQLADARGYSQAVIYGLERSDRTPEFYAAGRVTYGADGEPVVYEKPWDVILESKRRNAPVLAFVRLKELNLLTTITQAQTEVIGDNGHNALVAVRAR
jgi:4-amino-4-deoxy-L-arabinose transferase-like glycosyltransferase